ncbi:hypothetical protein SAMN05444278_1142 [Psychroflexus salarius]|uniref:Uncharacterized protein n=1 Tax=Psychroflexus salarius TaxID=1155689 RepID=A0A1M4Y582_9FLAO|nr:hypothetical protein [Psychroflexus salarius]SHF00977.1 hypothetical protein SAMN05444278_1142 [Psychroflexus salarius]
MRKNGFLIAIVVLIAFTSLSYCQTIDEAIGFEDNVDDEPAATINTYIYSAILAGVFIGVRCHNK